MFIKTTLVSLLMTFSFNAFAGESDQQISIGVSENGAQILRNSFFYYNFGRVMTGTLHTARYTVTNTGTLPLRFLRATIGGSIDFDGYHSCSNGLQPKQVCWFEIRYWPAFEGWDHGRFVIAFDQENTITVDLSGDAYRL